MVPNFLHFEQYLRCYYRSYNAILYDTISNQIQYNIVSYHFTQNDIISYDYTQYRIISSDIILYYIIQYCIV